MKIRNAVFKGEKYTGWKNVTRSVQLAHGIDPLSAQLMNQVLPAAERTLFRMHTEMRLPILTKSSPKIVMPTIVPEDKTSESVFFFSDELPFKPGTKVDINPYAMNILGAGSNQPVLRVTYSNNTEGIVSLRHFIRALGDKTSGMGNFDKLVLSALKLMSDHGFIGYYIVREGKSYTQGLIAYMDTDWKQMQEEHEKTGIHASFFFWYSPGEWTIPSVEDPDSKGPDRH